MTKRPLQERLEETAKKRAVILDRFGFIPMSVLKLSRGKLHRSLFHLAKEKNLAGLTKRVESIRKTEDGRATSNERRRLGVIETPYTVSKNRTVVSMMSAELVAFALEYYLPTGGVYLDPFSGQGVQAQVAAIRNVDYYGMDLSAEYVDFTHAVLRRYRDSTAAVVVTRGDSRHPDWIDDASGDFCFTSPPYWDIEFYTDDEEQLGLDATYPEFLAGMEDVFAAWRPKFKTGATVVVNVNDFRRDGEFYPYHADTINLMTHIGYELHDLWIVDGLVGGLPRAFAVKSNNNLVAPKVHEYLLIFKAA